jgi:large subunit ribosomal protein L29
MANHPTPQELREMEAEELTIHARQARRDLFDLRFQGATGELENTSAIGAARRHIARTITVARERGIDISKGIEE